MNQNIALPIRQGTKEHGFNANTLYDANGDSIAVLYGLPQNIDLEELGRAVEAREFGGAWVVGMSRAAFIVTACNSHDNLVSALKLMRDAWDIPDDTKRRREQRAKAWNSMTAALAAAEVQP